MNTPVPDPPAADPSPSQRDATGEQGLEETFVPGEADTGTGDLAKMAKAQQAKHAIFRVCCLFVEQPCQRLLLPHVDSFCLRIGSKGVQSAEGNVCRSKRAFFRGWPVCGTLPVIGLFIEYQVRGYCRSHVIWFSATSVQCPKCVACARVAAALSTSFQVVCFATGQIGSRVVELCL